MCLGCACVPVVPVAFSIAGKLMFTRDMHLLLFSA
jgi:hypothetical protein